MAKISQFGPPLYHFILFLLVFGGGATEPRPNFEISFRNGFFNKFSYFIEIGGGQFFNGNKKSFQLRLNY